MSVNVGIIYAAFILIGLYIMIIFEVINIAKHLHSCIFYKYYQYYIYYTTISGCP